MAPGAKIHLPLAREVRRIQNTGTALGSGLRCKTSSVLFPRAVAFLTSDAEGETGFLVSIGRWRTLLEISRMAFQATRNHRAVKVGRAIPISRTVHPA